MRTFIAIDIITTPEIQNLLTDFHQNLQGIDLKLVESTNYHVTLAFLGETSELQSKLICNELNHATLNTVNLSLQGLGVFKNNDNPQVLWIGIEADNHLTDLWKHVNQTISNHGFKPDERGFSPHLTVGRVRKEAKNHNLSIFLEKNKNAFFGKFSLNEFIFYQSILTPQGPIYKPIRKFKLK